MAENKVTMAISVDFINSLMGLPKTTQNKVTSFLEKFRKNPQSSAINYEKVKGAIDKKIFSVRIDDTYRGIVARQPENGVYILLWVDHHDKAYAWASRKRCEVNAQTGVLQVYEITTGQGRSEPEATPPAGFALPRPGLFDHVKDKDLLAFGLPAELLPLVRAMRSEEDLVSASPALPADAFEILEYLANDCPLQEIRDVFGGRPPDGPSAQPPMAPDAADDLAAALQNDVTRSHFVVIEGEEELRRILDGPLEKWRVFLHPQQRKLASKNCSGPSRVLGGAGTGKTVVAMHRAKWLASQCTGQELILFTTFTRNLATDIKYNLKKICSPDEYRHIDVYNLDLWINKFMESQNYDFKISYGEEISRLWDEAIALNPNANDYGKTFFREEWAQIVTPQETFTLDEYLKASRLGRGTRLDGKQREQVWGVFKTFINLMEENKLRDIDMATYECRNIIENMNLSPLYSSVIVDEGQDFGVNDYKLIRKIAGDERQNDLFIVGDAHQRIYNKKTVLSKCGINIAGRGGYLRLNYRTTEEIRKQAINILKDETIDDLDGGHDEKKPCQSLTHGKPPVIKGFKDFDQELAFIVGEIKKLTLAEDDLRNVCLVARTNKLVENYKTELMRHGFPVYQIQLKDSDDQTKKGIRLATMHRVKGLEFRYVFIAAVNDRIIPHAKSTLNAEEVTKRERVTSEKCLLYVAMTRAQKLVYLTSFGQRSELLQAFD